MKVQPKENEKLIKEAQKTKPTTENFNRRTTPCNIMNCKKSVRGSNQAANLQADLQIPTHTYIHLLVI